MTFFIIGNDFLINFGYSVNAAQSFMSWSGLGDVVGRLSAGLQAHFKVIIEWNLT